MPSPLIVWPLAVRRGENERTKAISRGLLTTRSTISATSSHRAISAVLQHSSRAYRVNVTFVRVEPGNREGEESKPMTHGQEKSNLFIVALKPANKPGRLGAELVEPRERTEGNTGEEIDHAIGDDNICRVVCDRKVFDLARHRAFQDTTD
jgi:hypothetical protein